MSPSRMGELPQPWRDAVQKVIFTGGALTPRLTHPMFTFFEQVWRRLPEQGIHSSATNPSQPLSIALGSFRVPHNQNLLLFDLRPDIYTYSGADPNDYVPVEPRRFAGQIGWDVTVDGQRPGNTRYELQPIPRQPDQTTQGSSQPGSTATAAEFAAARANQFGAALGAGLALQPQRHQRYGPESMPLTLWLRENQTFRATAGIFRRILSPIAFFEYDLAGILMPATVAADIFNAIAPRQV